MYHTHQSKPATIYPRRYLSDLIDSGVSRMEPLASLRASYCPICSSPSSTVAYFCWRMISPNGPTRLSQFKNIVSRVSETLTC